MMKADKAVFMQNQFHEDLHSGCLLISNNHNQRIQRQADSFALAFPYNNIVFFRLWISISSLFKVCLACTKGGSHCQNNLFKEKY